MKRIVIVCPTCGPVYPLPVEVRLTVYSAIERSYCDIRCGSCVSTVRSPLTPQQVTELVDVGVDLRFCHLPVEALEAGADGPLTGADVAAFVQALDRFETEAGR